MDESASTQREVLRLQHLATLAHEAAKLADEACMNAFASADIERAGAYLRGPATTFAQALLRIVNLA